MRDNKTGAVVTATFGGIVRASVDNAFAIGPRAALTVAGAIGGWAEALAVAAPWGAVLPLPRLLEAARDRGLEVVIDVNIAMSTERILLDVDSLVDSTRQLSDKQRGVVSVAALPSALG